MAKISVLGKELVDKIAAGEVIERPASVVKELIENSLDANARKIHIELKEGGKSLIRVEDDGDGMDKEDMEIVAQRHSSSKIASLHDLFNIQSFGFRGEALSSIAAVSELTIKTRAESSIVGTKLTLTDDQRAIENTACPKGTILEVKNLFYNTPARKKYLKSIEYELGEIADIATRYALCFPEVFFKLTHDEKLILNAPPTTNTFSNISNIYGNHVAKNLLQVDFIHEDIDVMGFISRPQLTKPNRDFQSIFINHRYIKSKLISDAITEAYHTLLMVGRSPVAILNIDISPREIDVNVHPTKREIKFSHESEVYEAVFNAVRKTLMDNELIKELESPQLKQDVLISKQEIPKAGEKKTAQKKYEPPRSDQLMLKETESAIKKKNLPEMKLIGQLHKTYIIAEGEDCIYLIDQHAAQERVNYEKFMQQLFSNIVATQALLTPIVLELSPKEYTLVISNLELLTKLGFNVEEFGTNTILIKTFPVILPNQDKQLILDLIDELEIAQNKIDEEKEKLLTMRACKASVKANQPLTLFEISKIIEELSSAESPYTCPHGRPIILRITIDELEKMFKRK